MSACRLLAMSLSFGFLIWPVSTSVDVLKSSRLLDTLSLQSSDWFGQAVAFVGDIDGDGVEDAAIGASGDDDGGTNRGAVYIAFLTSSGSVARVRKISQVLGGFTGLDNLDYFGNAVASLGDLDGDGVPDIAVGAFWDNEQDENGGDTWPHRQGAVWILFLNRDGTVKASQKISGSQGELDAQLQEDGAFGCSIANVGDLNSDGVQDLVVGACNDDAGGRQTGALYVLFMKASGKVLDFTKISATQGMVSSWLQLPLDNGGRFGCSLATLGDIDGDSTTEIVVGACLAGVANIAQGSSVGDGAVWVLSLTSTGTVVRYQKHTLVDVAGSQYAGIRAGFGTAIAGGIDINGNGVPDVVVGARQDKEIGLVGSVWVLYLNDDSSVASESLLPVPALAFGDQFGSSLAAREKDSTTQLLVGAVGVDGSDTSQHDLGAVWFMEIQDGGHKSALDLRVVAPVSAAAACIAIITAAVCIVRCRRKRSVKHSPPPQSRSPIPSRSKLPVPVIPVPSKPMLLESNRHQKACVELSQREFSSAVDETSVGAMDNHNVHGDERLL